MPHKVNPKRVVKVIAMAARLRALAAPAMDAGQPSHEGDSAANHLLAAVLDEACPLAWRLAAGFDDLLGRIEPQPGRMSENLQRSGAFIASENLMMVLAPRMGRTQAHDLVHALLGDARRHDGSRRRRKFSSIFRSSKSVPRSIRLRTWGECGDRAGGYRPGAPALCEPAPAVGWAGSWQLSSPWREIDVTTAPTGRADRADYRPLPQRTSTRACRSSSY